MWVGPGHCHVLSNLSLYNIGVIAIAIEIKAVMGNKSLNCRPDDRFDFLGPPLPGTRRGQNTFKSARQLLTKLKARCRKTSCTCSAITLQAINTEGEKPSVTFLLALHAYCVSLRTPYAAPVDRQIQTTLVTFLDRQDTSTLLQQLFDTCPSEVKLRFVNALMVLFGKDRNRMNAAFQSVLGGFCRSISNDPKLLTPENQSTQESLDYMYDYYNLGVTLR